MPFKLFACMVVKNEADIIEYTVKSALNWASYIIIMDNNSNDETLSVIKKLCSQNENVIFWGRYEGAFRDSLRAIIYNDFKHLSSPGDWWCRLDADEIYIDNPLDFIQTICDTSVDHIYSASFQYYLTAQDAQSLQTTPSAFSPDRYNFYRCDWSEIRFVKIRKNTIWPLSFAQPILLDSPSNNRIKLKHYQYRSIEQMHKRYNDRAPALGKKLFSHEISKNKLWNPDELNIDTGVYTYFDSNLPEIKKRHYIVRVLSRFTLFIINRFKIRRLFEPSNEKV